MIAATLKKTRKEIHHGIRFAEFEYKFTYDGGVNIKNNKKEVIKLSARDHELELFWNIHRSYQENSKNKEKKDLVWDKIILQECPKNVFGNILVHVNHYGYSVFDHFHYGSVSREMKKNKVIRCYINGDNINVLVQVYRQDDRIESMIQDYDKLLATKSYSDVLFIIGPEREKIPAHRVIIAARSDVFSAMLECDMKEKKSGQIEIDDIEPEIFKKMLVFMYSGKVDVKNNTSDLLKLIALAHRYKVDSLEKICSYRLNYNINNNNVADILVVADLIQDDVLKKNCLYFVVNNKDTVISSESFRNMVEARKTDLLLEILHLLSSVEINYSQFHATYYKIKADKEKDIEVLDQTPSTSSEICQSSETITEDIIIPCFI